MAVYVEYTRDTKGRVTYIRWFEHDPSTPTEAEVAEETAEDEETPFKVMGITYGANDMITRVTTTENGTFTSDVEYIYDSNDMLIQKNILV